MVFMPAPELFQSLRGIVTDISSLDFYSKGTAFTHSLGYSLCTSSICDETGAKLIENMNKTVLPCSDFYQHACGGWIANHPIDNYPYSFISQFILIVTKVDKELKVILETHRTMDTGAVQKAKDFYNTCRDRGAITLSQVADFDEMVSGNGGWPLIESTKNWNTQNPNLTWQKMHENFMNETEFAGLFKITVDVEMMDPKKYVITLQSVLTPGESSQISYQKISLLTRSRINYNLHMTDDINKMIEFEEALKQAFSESSTHNNNSLEYRLTTIEEIQSIWDVVTNNNSQYKINWLETIRRRFEGIDVVINKNETIALMPGFFLEKLGALLTRTPISVIVNYIHWYAVSLGMRSVAITDNVDRGPMRAVCECCKFHLMNHALAFMYVNEHFKGPDSTRLRESVTEIYRYLRDTVEDTIDNTTWMDEQSRKLFREKIDHITFNIGYPEWYDKPGKLDEYYDELTIGTNHFKNILAFNRFNSRKALRKLRTRIERSEIDWPSMATEPVPKNHRLWNSIYIPAASLQMPIFHPEQPAALKFGAMGAILGHEIFHAFDITGLQRTINGSYGFWLPETSAPEYERKASCILDQFDKYPVKDEFGRVITHIDGTTTLNENMSDNGGFMMAYRAFERFKKSHPKENVKIRALVDYSDKQLFFYGLANVFCDLKPSSALISDMEYPPANVRINQVLSNIQAFSDSFECAPGDPMNPSDRCIMWD